MPPLYPKTGIKHSFLKVTTKERALEFSGIVSYAFCFGYMYLVYLDCPLLNRYNTWDLAFNHIIFTPNILLGVAVPKVKDKATALIIAYEPAGQTRERALSRSFSCAMGQNREPSILNTVWMSEREPVQVTQLN